MRKAWIRQEPTGWASQPHQYRLISESTLFPGKAQPHVNVFGSQAAAAKIARDHGLDLTGEPLRMPLVTEDDRDAYRLAAQKRCEQALNLDRCHGEPVVLSNVVAFPG